MKFKAYATVSAWEPMAPLPLAFMGARCGHALASAGGYTPLNVKVSVLWCCFSIFHYGLKKKISSVKIAIFTVQLRKKCLYSIDCRDNCVAGLDFSKWNLSFSHGCLGDCSFLWQSFCDVRNHMLYTKLNLKCEWIVCKRGSVEVLWAITNLSCNAGFKFHYLLDSTFLIFGSYFVIWLVQ